MRWPGTDLNRRHPVLQTGALPTELPGRRGHRISSGVVGHRSFAQPVSPTKPVGHGLMRDAQLPRDIAQAGAFPVELLGPFLERSAAGGAFGLTELGLEAADLALGGPGWPPGLPKEGSRAAAPVIIGARVTGATEGFEQLEGVVPGEAERIVVMDVERAAVLLGRPAAPPADLVARAHEHADLLPPGAVRERATPTPAPVPLAAKVRAVVVTPVTLSRAVLALGSIPPFDIRGSPARVADDGYALGPVERVRAPLPAEPSASCRQLIATPMAMHADERRGGQ